MFPNSFNDTPVSKILYYIGVFLVTKGIRSMWVMLILNKIISYKITTIEKVLYTEGYLSFSFTPYLVKLPHNQISYIPCLRNSFFPLIILGGMPYIGIDKSWCYRSHLFL